MAQRSRIPVRRAAAAINDENKVGAPADPHGTGAAAPIKAVGAVRPVAPAGAGSRLAAKPITAGPAKAFGAPVAGATNAVSRGVLCDVGRLRAPGIVSRLAKPSEVADRLPIKTARVASSGIVKPAVLGQRVRQPVAAAVAVAARPTISAVRAPVLSARPISRPGASFGMRRARQPDAPPAPVAAPVPVAEPVGAALAKRVRTASASNVIPQPTAGAAAATSLGKHTRSGHVTRSVSSDPVLPAVGGLRLAAAPAAAAESGCESADDLASTAVASSATSLNLGSLQSSPDAGNLGDLKFVDVDTIDYALVHTGLENEVPITLSEINVFEADVDPTDPAMLSEFSDDIFGYMRELEVKLMPDPRYIAGQPALSWSTRAVLVEWL
ncbi:B-type cyclin, partial [Coemansia spiralis]